MRTSKIFGIQLLCILLLCSCGAGNNDPATARFGKPARVSDGVQSTPARPSSAVAMQPLQPGQPPQKPDQSISTVPAIAGGAPGDKILPFNQPFRLADKEYQFMAARGKDFVGLESNPAMRPSQGYAYFLVRYQVISHAAAPVSVPNWAAVHLISKSTNQVTNIDTAATNANTISGAATGMPEQLDLEPNRPQIQTLAFQVPANVNANDLAILVTEPADPTRVFQLVSVSN